MLAIERKRTERSKNSFLLMLLGTNHTQELGKNGRVLDGVACTLLSCTRETDVIGWYKDRTTVGVMYTGIEAKDKNAVLSIILNRVSEALRNALISDQLDQITISFHFFPDDWDRGDSREPPQSCLVSRHV